MTTTTQRKPQKLRKVQCQHCGNFFFAKSPLAKFCRVSCQTTAWRHSAKGRQARLAKEWEEQQSQPDQSNLETNPTATQE